LSLQPISLVSEIEQYINLAKDTNAAQETSITWSGASHTVLKKAPDASLNLPASTQWAEDTPTGLGKEDTIILTNAGDNTQYTRTFAWRNLRGFLLDKVTFNIALGHNISAYTSGSPNFDSFNLTFRQYINGQFKPIVPDNKISTGHSALSATGTQSYIYEESFTPGVKIEDNSIIAVAITMNVTTGTSTYQAGLYPAFPYSKTNTTKWFSQSGVYMLGRSTR
jgi:hypothetical protein